jgi:hypothetical protein
MYLDRGETKCQDVGEGCIMRHFVTCTLRHVKEDEMGRVCHPNGGEDECTWDIG